MKTFLSSTYTDLKDHRRALIDTMMRMGDLEIVAMEYFGASPLSPVKLSVNKVEESDLYLGLFGWRYGTINPQWNMSITEIEYRTALARDIPLFLYVLSKDHSVSPDAMDSGESAEKIRQLRDEICESHVVQFFTTPDDLAKRAAADLYAYQRDPSRSRTAPASIDGPVEATINPAHPFILSHFSQPSGRPDYYTVQVYVDLYYDEDAPQYATALASVSKVVYQLHHSFDFPVVPMQNWRENWLLHLEVFGEFWMQATIYFKHNRPPLQLTRYINLPSPKGFLT